MDILFEYTTDLREKIYKLSTQQGWLIVAGIAGFLYFRKKVKKLEHELETLRKE